MPRRLRRYLPQFNQPRHNRGYRPIMRLGDVAKIHPLAQLLANLGVFGTRPVQRAYRLRLPANGTLLQRLSIFRIRSILPMPA
jgi:hypothetical protein